MNSERNSNILSPKGSIGRLRYSLYTALFIVIINILPEPKESLLLLLLECLSYLLIFVLIIFNVKKRIYDITAKSALSWIFTALFITILMFSFSNYAQMVVFIANLFLILKRGKTDNFIVM